MKLKLSVFLSLHNLNAITKTVETHFSYKFRNLFVANLEMYTLEQTKWPLLKLQLRSIEVK